MRYLIATLAAIALAAPVLAQEAAPPPGCTPVATLIYQDCGVSVVSACENAGADDRLYQFYREGQPSSWSLRQDGVFALVATGGKLHRVFEIPDGLLQRALAAGEGRTATAEFATETRRGGETKRLTGTMRITHRGAEAYPLPDGPVEVVRLDIEGRLSDGSATTGTRLIDLERKLMLLLEVEARYPDRPTQHFDYRTIQRLLPGDPGFGAPVPPPGSGCGARS